MRLNENVKNYQTEFYVDPALLTLREYLELANKDDTHHDSSAYATTLKQLNTYNAKESEYPILLQQKTINGILFTFRLKKDRKIDTYSYYKKDINGNYLHDASGNLVQFTKEELEKGAIPSLLTHPYEYSISVFDDQKNRVAATQDEYGCMLIRVAEEYRGFGIGQILGKMARTLESDKVSGGFTYSGENNFVRVHREFVRDYLLNGEYRRLVKEKKISYERLQKILKSADLNLRPVLHNKKNYNVSPHDYLIYTDDGLFCIYDKKLVDIINDEDDFFIDRFLVGMVYTTIDENADEKLARIKIFGGESEKIKSFLMKLILNESSFNGEILVVEPEDVKYLPSDAVVSTQSKKYGYTSVGAILKNPKNTASIGKEEKAFRKKFDKYNEFYYNMIELFYKKFDRRNRH